MADETFADPAVRDYLAEHFEFVEVDVTDEAAAAGWFAAHAVPDT